MVLTNSGCAIFGSDSDEEPEACDFVTGTVLLSES